MEGTLPETNILAPENGWLEYDRFLLGWPIFKGENVSFREGSTGLQIKNMTANGFQKYEPSARLGVVSTAPLLEYQLPVIGKHGRFPTKKHPSDSKITFLRKSTAKKCRYFLATLVLKFYVKQKSLALNKISEAKNLQRWSFDEI